jgi:hypothetical protein
MGDLTIRLDSEEYVLRRGDDGLRVGRRVDGDVTWLDTVDLGLLPAPAREALERGDTSDPSLVTALRGVTQAEVERGS